MKLYAISDLHLGFEANRDALQTLEPHRDDWLILGGDIGETQEHLRFAFDTLAPRFAKLIWIPGNHELWTMSKDSGERGDEKYQALIKLCRSYNVLTPEDPYPLWDCEGQRSILVPLFLLYDYSFRPEHVTADNAIAWAMEAGILCSDEELLHPDPHPSRQAWCQARCDLSEQRLAKLPSDLPMVLINHFPLRQDLVRIPAVPRFSIWCGTTRTTDWHIRYRACAVVSGHLHVPRTDYRDGVRFEEVSWGYPRQWQGRRTMNGALREILPGRAVKAP